MTDVTAAYFDVPHRDGRSRSFGITGRTARSVARKSGFALCAVAGLGVATLSVTFAAAWIAGSAMQPRVGLPSGPGSLVLVPYTPPQQSALPAPATSKWADAFSNSGSRLVVTPPVQLARLTPAAQAPAPAPKAARAANIPVPRPMPAALLQLRAQAEAQARPQAAVPALPVAKPEIVAAAVAPKAIEPPAAVKPEVKPEPKPVDVKVEPKAEPKAEPKPEFHSESKIAALAKPMTAPATAPALTDSVARTAVYDITRSIVHMPDGSKLEAHSGLGERMDDPRHIKVRMRGPTPPNVYVLTERESLFHGVRAIRLNPVHKARMYGRDGMLAHTYMLGPNGQSNGCVSFKNYNQFLNAFLDGKVDKLVVVGDLGNTSWRTAAMEADGVRVPERRFAGNASRPRRISNPFDDGPATTSSISALGFAATQRSAAQW